MQGKKSHRRKGILKKKLLYGIGFAIIILSIAFIYFSQHSPNQTTSQIFQFKAAIVDQGSLSPAAGPNPVFIETATNILETANFTVDYYPGEEVTVEFYRNLPTHGYGLIILRVHSLQTDPQTGEGSATLFTSERISQTKYVYEQLTDQLRWVAYSNEEAEKGIGYFGISPLFVKQAMKDKFENTVLIMMGCEGLVNPVMAKAFVEKGAKVYISWNGSVSASHTDQATVHLIQHLITEKQTIKKAVTETMNEVGPDPADGSILLYYPDTLVDNYVIPNIASNLTMNGVQTNIVFYIDKKKMNLSRFLINR